MKVSFATVARLYKSNGSGSWDYQNVWGAVALVSDDSSNYIRMYNIPASALIFEQELYTNFDYSISKPFFHTFESDECMHGLSFADAADASCFASAIQTLIGKDTKSSPNIPKAGSPRVVAESNGHVRHPSPKPLPAIPPTIPPKSSSVYSTPTSTPPSTSNSVSPNATPPVSTYSPHTDPPPATTHTTAAAAATTSKPSAAAVQPTLTKTDSNRTLENSKKKNASGMCFFFVFFFFAFDFCFLLSFFLWLSSLASHY